MYPPEAFGAFLTRQGVLLKDFKPYVQALTATLKAHAQRLAADAGRPYVWLQSSTTRRQGRSKEDLARDIAARDGVVEGLVCVLGVLEPATTFTVRGNRATGQLEVARTSTTGVPQMVDTRDDRIRGVTCGFGHGGAAGSCYYSRVARWVSC